MHLFQSVHVRLSLTQNYEKKNHIDEETTTSQPREAKLKKKYLHRIK